MTKTHHGKFVVSVLRQKVIWIKVERIDEVLLTLNNVLIVDMDHPVLWYGDVRPRNPEVFGADPLMSMNQHFMSKN